jgi:hypothetical protein
LAATLDRELAGIRARELDRELERDLALTVDHAYILARSLDRDGSVAGDHLALAENLVRVLARARYLAFSRIRARNLIPTLNRAHRRARNLVHTLKRKHGRTNVLDQTLALLRALASLVRPARRTDGANPAAGKVAQSLVAMAVKVLPAQHQDRYGEEFRAELHELHSRWQQLKYAFNVLSSAGKIRRALMEKIPFAGTSEHE